jgi:hypothetical protein
VCAREQAFVLQVRDVLVDGGQRPEIEAARDLLKRGGITIPLHEAGNEFQHFLLPAGYCHMAHYSE